MNPNPIQPDPSQPSRDAVPWYRRAFEENYLELYRHRDQAEAARAVTLLARLLSLRPEHRLLDLCCGPGRHMVFLAREVGHIVGLDLSRVLLARARTHWQEVVAAPAVLTPPARRPKGLLVQGTMRQLPLASECVDRVVNLFTSFGYFEDEASNRTVLSEVARILRPGPEGEPGLFVIDHINREAMLAGLVPSSERELPGGQRVFERRRWDEATCRVTKQVRAIEPDGTERTWHESVRVYRPEELEGMLAGAGLKVSQRLGDYDGKPWRPDSPRLLLIAHKNPKT